MATCIGSFADSKHFKIDEQGNVRHRREGTSYAAKVIDGVHLDTTLHFEAQGYMYIEEESEQNSDKQAITVVSSESSSSDKRQKKKKKHYKHKNYETKPKSRGHNRLSKIAMELGDVSLKTELSAQIEEQSYWDSIEEEKRRTEISYWDSWKERVREEPGTIAYVELDVSLDPNHVPIYDIDKGGVNRDCPNPHGWFMESNDPAYNRRRWSNNREERAFFTYWDDDMQTYLWIPYDMWSGIFEYEPTQEVLKSIFWLSKERKEMEPGYFIGGPNGLSYHLDDLQWDVLWRHMDYLRIGLFRNAYYNGGSKILRSLSHMTHYYLHYKDPLFNLQIPNITFE